MLWFGKVLKIAVMTTEHISAKRFLAHRPKKNDGPLNIFPVEVNEVDNKE